MIIFLGPLPAAAVAEMQRQLDYDEQYGREPRPRHEVAREYARQEADAAARFLLRGHLEIATELAWLACAFEREADWLLEADLDRVLGVS